MATDPVVPESRRFSIQLPRPRWIGLGLGVLLLSASVSGGPADDEVGEDDPRPVQRFVIAGPGADLQQFVAVTRNELDAYLRQKVAIVDRLCGLTDGQKQTLQLAGRGDIKRWLDRFEKNRTQWPLVQNDRNKVKALDEENQSLVRARDNRATISNDGSLFVKSLEKMVTSEQVASLRVLRDVLRAGGLVQPRQRGSGKFLEINLSYTKFADEDLANLRLLSGINGLNLAHTPISDAGVAHLKDLTEMRELWLGNTQLTDGGLAHLEGFAKLERVWLDDAPVTDAGLVHLRDLKSLCGLSLTNTQTTNAGLVQLKGLIKLKWLYLDGTQVTDAGIVELQSTLTDLRIHK